MPPPGPAVEKERGWGCCGCGCAILLVIAVLIVALGILGVRLATQMGLSYTTAQPVQVPTEDGGDAVFRQAETKLDSFTDAFERVQPATLRLSAKELNTLVARDRSYANLRGHFHVALQGDQAEIESSYPIGSMEKVFLADRYLDSDATVGLGVDPATHALQLDLRDVRMNGRQLPPNYAPVVATELNVFLNQQLQANQLARDFMARVQKAGIENGELVIEIR